jgi:cytochrome c
VKKCLIVLCVGLIGAGVVNFTLAATPAEEAKTMVEEAVAFLNAQGKEKAIAEISNPKGKFVKGGMYVFAYDLNATVIAHPVNPKLIGNNLMDVPDANGKFFRKDVVELAKTKGVGWVDYKYKNPASNKVENKTTYLRKAGDVIICCGTYK